MKPLLFLLVAGVAGAGHAAIWVHANNWLHSLRWHNLWIKLARLLCHAINAGGIVAFVLWHGPDLATKGGWTSLPAALQAYLAACLLLGGLFVPYVLWRRWTEQPPRHLIKQRSTVIDIAEQLGHRPYGSSRRSLLARLPANEIFQVEFSERELWLPGLPPPWDGLTLLHLTDLHFCGCPSLGFFEKVVDQVATERFDLIALTGDLIDTDHHYSWLKPLLGRLRWRFGAFAVLGNHDSWFDHELVRNELADLKIACVAGRWELVPVRELPLLVAGNEAPWLRPGGSLAEAPPAVFRLGLSHSPDQLPWARAERIDLLLAGHNHGGQIRLPGIGPLFVPSRNSGLHASGLFWEEPTLLLVSRGLSGTTPVRYRCRPEVCKLILRSGPP